jgi:hypothetical protein
MNRSVSLNTRANSLRFLLVAGEYQGVSSPRLAKKSFRDEIGRERGVQQQDAICLRPQ